MNYIKLTRLAIVGAALLLSAAITAPSWAAPVGPAATQSIIGQTDSSLTDVRYYGHRGRHRGHHRGGFHFFFAPVVIHDGYYGGRRSYGGRSSGGPSCYSICRDYHGPDYCRYNWRRYC
jgi:hypothetical protein